MHAKCLYKWRSTSTSPASANTCGQCHYRYRLQPPKGGSKGVWALNNQALRLLIAIAGVALATLLSGFVSLYTIQAVGKVPFARKALLYTLQEAPPPYRIRLLEDRPTIRVVHMPDFALDRPSFSFHADSDPNQLARATIDAFALMQTTKRGDPVWYDLAAIKKAEAKAAEKKRKQQEGEASSDAATAKAGVRSSWVRHSDTHGFVTAIVQLSKDAGRKVSQVWKTRGARVTSLFWPKPKPVAEPPTPERDETKHWISPDLSASIEHAVSSADPSSSDDDIRTGVANRGLREVTIEHSFPEFSEPYGDSAQSVLVRYLPESIGPLRYVPFGFYMYLRWNLFQALRIFRRSFVTISRCAIGIRSVFLSKRGGIEVVWLLAKVVVSGALAYLREEMQAARPPPRLVPGALVPQRSKSRLYAGLAHDWISAGANMLFGPYWLNWWGGYSSAIWLRPQATSWSLMESLVFMQLVAGPTVMPVIVDGVTAGLSRFSSIARWFRSRYTVGWVDADWTHYDASASEGYRRLLSTLLGDANQGKVSRYDIFLAKRGGRLLTGRVRPVEVASLATRAQESWFSYFELLMTLGALVLTTVGLLWLLRWTSKELLRGFIMQINMNVRHLFALAYGSEPVVFIRRFVTYLRRESLFRWRRRSRRARARGNSAERGRGIRARFNPMLDALDAATPEPEERRDQTPEGEEQPEHLELHGRPEPLPVAVDGGIQFELALADMAIGVAIGPPQMLPLPPANRARRGGLEEEEADQVPAARPQAGDPAAVDAAAARGGNPVRGALGDDSTPTSRSLLAVADLCSIYGSAQAIHNILTLVTITTPFM